MPDQANSDFGLEVPFRRGVTDTKRMKGGGLENEGDLGEEELDA